MVRDQGRKRALLAQQPGHIIVAVSRARLIALQGSPAQATARGHEDRRVRYGGGRQAGIFQGRPRAFQQQAELRIKQGGVARGNVEEPRVKIFLALDTALHGHIIGIADDRFGNPGGA